MSRYIARRVSTIFALGLKNVLKVIFYRLKKKSGFFRWRSPVEELSQRGRFLVCDQPGGKEGVPSDVIVNAADSLLSGTISLFGGAKSKIEVPPNWNVSQTSKISGSNFSDHWTLIPDFDPRVGDIKTVWEPSRFSWALLFSRAALVSGELKYLQACNDWIASWCTKNPLNQGPNWMSGQEIAIRLIHLLIADALLRVEVAAGDDLETVVFSHCQSIRQTIAYGCAQNNNHGISEAAGLFIGGSWLEQNARLGESRKKGRQWASFGRKVLEGLVGSLILDDGTFSQYSMTYHRLMLDTLTIIEWWRRRSGSSDFSSEFYRRSRAATRWLFEFVDPISGDVANIGANDGALVYSLCDSGHRDFRPAVQLAGAIFLQTQMYTDDGPWNESLVWFGIELPDLPNQSKRSHVYQQGGFVILRSIDRASFAICRFPVYRFRPSHADALHLDLWHNGVNVLRDGGSFSYAAGAPFDRYFSGVESHNTIQFDERDQMPKVGRFLFADWLNVEELRFEDHDEFVKWRAAYTDREGCRHEREVILTENRWRVTDRVAGQFMIAKLRWRLCPEYEWQLHGLAAESTNVRILISSDGDLRDVRLTDGYESRIYLEKSEIPVFEISLGPGNQTIVTDIEIYPT